MRPLASAFLRRLARSSHASRVVLRGSLVTATWCPGRVADDVDLLVTEPSSVDEALAMTKAIVAEPDEAPIALVAHETIWAETPLPGLRARLAGAGEEGELQVDVGWGDPLTVPPRPLDVGGGAVLAVAPETMFGWKAHGLVEHGSKWRAKDLFDLLLLLEHAPLDRAALPEAVRVAFTSRGDELTLLSRFLFSGEWGRSRGSRRKWEAFRRRWRGPIEVPRELAAVSSRVRAALAPIALELGLAASWSAPSSARR